MPPALGPAALAAGYRLVAFDSIGSTNTEAVVRARAGDPGRLWLYSEVQTAGRGRRGRPWATPAGNLAASLLTVAAIAPATAATLGFVAGMALDRALADLVPEGAAGRLALKWPNDLLCGDAKLAGILLEAEPVGDGRLAIVAGIGVNVASAPEGLPYPATSLAALGVGLSAADLFARLSDAWVALAAVWDGGRGLDGILRLWLSRARGVGEPISVQLGASVIEGVFETVDAEGRLVLVEAGGRRRVIAAGDVHFGAAMTRGPDS